MQQGCSRGARRAPPRTTRRRRPNQLWFFSAGGLLMGSLLSPAPTELRAVAGTYAVLNAPESVVIELPQALDVVPDADVALPLVRPQHDVEWIHHRPTTCSGDAPRSDEPSRSLRSRVHLTVSSRSITPPTRSKPCKHPFAGSPSTSSRRTPTLAPTRTTPERSEPARDRVVRCRFS